MIAIVCGGRDYTNATRLAQILDAAVTRLGLDTIIEGECPTAVNADKLARDWAIARGDVSVIAVHPGTNWPSAGPVRNKLMLDILCAGEKSTPRALFAFRGGNGTANMIGLARSPMGRAAGIQVHEIDRETP